VPTTVSNSWEGFRFVKYRIGSFVGSLVLLAYVLATNESVAQSVAYRQTKLTSNVAKAANNVSPQLINPWGITFLSGQPFFIADNKVGRVTTYDKTGLGVRPNGFVVPNADLTGFDTPTGIIADQNSFFGDATLINPFILVSDQGAIFTWGPDARGNLPLQATMVVNRASGGASYKGVAILNSSSTRPALAVTDFHGGFIETLLPGFVPVALSGSFTDPNLPAGFAPFGIQVIGRQVFVTFAVQNAAKHDPVLGPGNGIVDIFDIDGNFVRRFVTGGALDAPWGIAQASANFGPFSNDILIGNLGDGKINAFDPATGQFLGVLVDGDGSEMTLIGLHGLAFRADGAGDANTLYFTSQLNSENDGLFGAIAPGLVSVTRVSAPDAAVDATVTITATVAAGPHNPGDPAGTVTFLDGSEGLATAPLVNGSATLDVTFSDVGAHSITAQYSGDTVFLPSSQRISLQINALATTTTLTAPADAAPGSTLTLTAAVNSTGGVPTGEVVFHDGAASLGTSPLGDSGVAVLRVNTLAIGAHSLTASYAGDGKFGNSTSAQVTINIANADFSVGAAPPSTTVIAGQSAQFTLSVTPVGGFASNVTFSCAPVVGITCTFNTPTTDPINGVAHTTLTVTTAANITHFGTLAIDLARLCGLLATLVTFGFILRREGKLRIVRPALLTATAMVTILGLSLVFSGCGGYGGGMQSNRGTASVVVTAQSGSISHTATVKVTVQ
jgi:uncharacterized protein (TIGR03118 family)